MLTNCFKPFYKWKRRVGCFFLVSLWMQMFYFIVKANMNSVKYSKNVIIPQRHLVFPSFDHYIPKILFKSLACLPCRSQINGIRYQQANTQSSLIYFIIPVFQKAALLANFAFQTPIWLMPRDNTFYILPDRTGNYILKYLFLHLFIKDKPPW